MPPLPLIAAIILTAYVPTSNARTFCIELQTKADNRNLEWVPPKLRADIHEASESMQLISGDCCFYSGTLLPISVDDCLNFQRRIRLNHIGSWQIREPDATRETDSDKISVLVDLFEQKLGIVVVSQIGGLSVDHPDLP